LSRTSVLIVDDHEAFRRTLRMRFEAMPEFVVCAEAADGVEAVELRRLNN
jgi:DNA-binding NarL/FixJ family response regulator